MGFFNWAAPIFGRFADRWDDAGIREITEWLRPHVPENGALLDVGGGTGALARRLSVSLGAQVTVLDPAPQMLTYAEGSPAVTAVLGTAEAMPFEGGSFDAVIVTDAFHHFRDQARAVGEFARVLKTGGGVVVVDLDPSGLLMRMIAFGEKLLGEPGSFFTPDEMCAFMAEHGIHGTCVPMSSVSYRFVGRTQQ